MKIAFTADLHLRSIHKHPERFNALDDILSQCVQLDIQQLIIAGDLFDKEASSYVDFEKICKKGEYKNINIKAIPGNHDIGILNQHFTLSNFEIFKNPTVIIANEDWNIMFIPYSKNKLMGEVIQSELALLSKKKWILVGHGDYIEGTRELNPYEPGVYMPLTRKDLEAFKPDKTFFGHIHQPPINDKVFYPGSPCAMDSTELGYRHFLVFDTEQNEVTKLRIDNEKIFFSASLVVFPTEDSLDLLATQIENVVAAWDIDEGDEEKVNIRLHVYGYSADRKVLDHFIREKFEKFIFEKELDLSEVKISNDPERDFILNGCLKKLDELKNELSLDDIRPSTYNSILDLIFGEK